jgi:tetratricopeptide (TPR) repeat protein
MRELDPLSPTGLMSGRVYLSSRRPDEAIRDLQETLELNPQSDLALQLLGHAYLQKGMNDQAIDAFRRAAALNGVRDSAHLAYGYAVTGHRDDGKRLIESLVASDGSRYLPPFHIALAYAGLGDKDAAFRWLERGYTEHASFMDALVDDGFMVLGGPLADEHRVAHVVEADSEEAVRATLARDPWSDTHLRIGSIDPWTLRLDVRRDGVATD